MELEGLRRHALFEQISLGAHQGLFVAQCQSEAVVDIANTSGPRVGVRADVAVATHDPAQVAALVVAGPVRSRGELSCAEELVVRGEMRPPVGALLRAGDELPTSPRQEPVIAARDELRAVLE